MNRQVDAIFISDVHLGSKGSNPKELLAMLDTYTPKHLFILGDFIDGWLLKQRHYWNQDFTNVIRKVLNMAKKGTKIVYITGNHDDFLRSYVPMEFDKNISIVNDYVFNDYYLIHGDEYDGIVKLKWLGKFGSFGYELAIAYDRILKQLGNKFSLSKFLKSKVKNAIKFIVNFEHQLAFQAKKRNCTGVICGHIHTPNDTIINNIHYLNCGDWVENNTYIVYNKNKFEILHW